MIAKLKSAAAVDLKKGDNEVYAVPDNSNGAKLSEITIANKTSAQVIVTVKIYKAVINEMVTILPGLQLLANEGRLIGMSTILETGDKVIVESNTSSSIDVLISAIEL